MATKKFLTVFILISALWTKSARAESYQLFPDNMLQLGNCWEYDLQVSIDDTQSLDKSDSLVIDVADQGSAAGCSYKVVRFTTGTGNWWLRFWYMSVDSIVEIAYGDEFLLESSTGGDPLERFPLGVPSTASNWHFGHGAYVGTLIDDPSVFWYGTQDTYVTFLRHERITVPAGTFDAVVIRHKWTFSDDYVTGYEDSIMWFDPRVGMLKWDCYRLDRVFGDDIVRAFVAVLEDSNVIHYQLAVDSRPVAGISVSGSQPGTTSYTRSCSNREEVHLSVQPTADLNGTVYEFSHWELDDVARPTPLNDVDFVMDNDRRAVAVYFLRGDANGDCRVDILDLLFARNRINKDVNSGDNWKGDVNNDGKVNILDLLFVRNHLHATCGQQ